MTGLFGHPGRWQGYVGCPLTPFDEADQVDADLYQLQVDFMINSGTPALCSLMHVGESLNLSREEREAITELTIDASAGRVPVIAHVSCPGTDHTVELARHAEKVGAEGVISITPYHWRPTPDGLLAHFAAIAESVEVPLLVYTYPEAAGVALTPELAARLIERSPTFLGIKEASNHLPTFTALAATTATMRPELSMLSGIEYMLPNRVMGGAGALSACAVVVPRLVHALWEAVAAVDFVQAVSLQARMSAVLTCLTPRYPATIKAAAEILGRDVGPTRLPVLPLSIDEYAELVNTLGLLGVLDEEPYGWDAAAGPDPDRARASTRRRALA